MAESSFFARIECIRQSDLPSTQKLILFALSTRCGKSSKCWPSIDTLKSDTGLAERTLQVHLKKLDTAGLLRIHTQAGPRGCNVFELTLSTGQVGAVDRNTPQQRRDIPAAAAPSPRSSCAQPAQQMRPKEHGKKQESKVKTHNVRFDSNFARKPESPAKLDSSPTPRQRRFSWKVEHDELIEIVESGDFERWRTLDEGWIRAFGNRDSRQRRHIRLTACIAAVRTAKASGGNAAKLLVSNLRDNGDGKAAEAFGNQSDAEYAREMLQSGNRFAQKPRGPVPDCVRPLATVDDRGIAA